ncbi:MAG: hypothetical protein PHD97_12765 [Bacteroidales bacterium]|nr:hypothetical protein [Bacteroidales bacterium]
MEKEIVKNKIIDLLESITEQTEIILSKEKKIPQIELDITMNYLRDLYEQFRVLNKINNSTASEKTESEEKHETPKEVKTENIKKSEIKEKKEEIKVVPQDKKEEYKTPVIETVTTEEKEEIKTTKKTKTQTPIDLFGDSVSILKDKFKTEPTINEKMSGETEDKRVISKIQNQASKDIKAAIGINEKFLFINELFDGNMEDYNEAINFLNENCSELSEAEIYIGKLSEKFSWDKNKSSFGILKNLVEKRFKL